MKYCHSNGENVKKKLISLSQQKYTDADFDFNSAIPHHTMKLFSNDFKQIRKIYSFAQQVEIFKTREE